MYNLVMKSNGKVRETFKTIEDAQNALDSLGRTKNFYRIEQFIEPAAGKTNWKESIDFTGAVNINRENVKHYYNKSGYIKVVDNTTGAIKHIGKTKNMGKVFSNYVNCARYNQSYDFDLTNGDRLYFKEAVIS